MQRKIHKTAFKHEIAYNEHILMEKHTKIKMISWKFALEYNLGDAEAVGQCFCIQIAENTFS